jgi:hypothetical protein
MIVHAMRPPQLQGPFALTNSENFELCSCHVQSRKCSFEGPMIFGLVGTRNIEITFGNIKGINSRFIPFQ